MYDKPKYDRKIFISDKSYILNYLQFAWLISERIEYFLSKLKIVNLFLSIGAEKNNDYN